jgi:uncharacterized membrane protein
MIDGILGYLELASYAISLFAVAVIVIGFVRSLGRYVLRFPRLEPDQNFGRLKIELALALTLGLEILVLADIIETITVEPSFRSLAVLALLVVIRTVLSWTLALNIEGHWPWRKPEQEQAHA